MQTGDCAGFGERPNAAARRLLSRVLWVGGLAVAGSVLGAASANAAEPSQVDEPSGDLIGSLTSAVEPVTGLTEPLLGDELRLTEDLQSDDASLTDVEVTGLVEQPIGELADTAAGLVENRKRDSAARQRAAGRDAAIETHTDRSMWREPVEEAVDGGADTADASRGTAPEPGLASLIGTVDRMLTTVDVPEVDAGMGELAEGAVTDVLPGGLSSGAPSFSTQSTSDPLGAVTGFFTLLDPSIVGGTNALEPLSPLLAPLDPLMRTAAPAVANLGPPAGQEPQETTRLAPAPLSGLAHTPSSSADAVPRISLDETGAARPAGRDGESAVIHSSPDAGTDSHDSSDGTRGGLRPSLLATPVAGLSALHVGAPGAATSADQAGPSSHALLPEEAVLRARLFSAAAYAGNIEAKPLREANDPPVSPD